MSVILKFSIAAEEFRLGQVLSGSFEMRYELERVVPTGNMTMPFVWVAGDDHAGFEETVRADSAVDELVVLDRFENRGLYRVEWAESPTDLVAAIDTTGASILRARGDATWVFQLRFDDHEMLSRFHDHVTDEGVPIRIERTSTRSAATEHNDRFDLTPEQREALLLALERGYFTTPRAVSLDELADELAVTRQALSDRIRRGNLKVLRGALLSPGPDFDEKP